MNSLKLGRKPYVESDKDLLFSRYSDNVVVPRTFGYGAELPDTGWGMLGNDEYGDCVWAGLAHAVMLWNKSAGRDVSFTTAGVLSDYSACTGFNPDDPSTDQGTDIRTAMEYLRTTGVVDATKARHKSAAYVNVGTSLTELNKALYIFGAVVIGLNLPDSAQSQFPGTWSYVAGSQIDGGHCVVITDRNLFNHKLVTWGDRINVGHRFLTHYVEEAWAIATPDFLNSSGAAANGFDMAQLTADLQEV